MPWQSMMNVLSLRLGLNAKDLETFLPALHQRWSVDLPGLPAGGADRGRTGAASEAVKTGQIESKGFGLIGRSGVRTQTVKQQAGNPA
jgi:hypothetical protein